MSLLPSSTPPAEHGHQMFTNDLNIVTRCSRNGARGRVVEDSKPPREGTTLEHPWTPLRTPILVLAGARLFSSALYDPAEHLPRTGVSLLSLGSTVRAMRSWTSFLLSAFETETGQAGTWRAPYPVWLISRALKLDALSTASTAYDHRGSRHPSWGHLIIVVLPTQSAKTPAP
jgi:hypothetical protein